MNRGRLLTILGPFLGLLFVYGFFASLDAVGQGSFERFGTLFTAGNLKTVAAQTTIVAVAALGMTVVILSAGIDLSPGSSIALVTVVVALTVQRLAPSPFLAALAATGAGVLVGALVGFINGLAVTTLRIVPFIVTLGMMGVARGVAKYLAGNTTVQNVPETWLSGLLAIDRRPDAPLWKLPVGVWVLLILAAGLFAVLRWSVFGRHVFAIGSNESAARLCGIAVARTKVLIYALAGAFTGVAGVLQFSRLAIGDPTAAAGLELNIIASVVIGGASLSGGKGGVPGTILGALIMGVLKNGCDIYGIPNYVQDIFIGLIIIVAVGLDQLRQRR
ncbi:MAG TPA: ABC transporter permease [Planctomycetota bacterium]|nr:ABC transporter permease [Planctomycetota bacterium]